MSISGCFQGNGDGNRDDEADDEADDGFLFIHLVWFQTTRVVLVGRSDKKN